MCESVINFNALPSGGMRRRRGSKYLCAAEAAHTSPQNIRIIPFRTATENFFILVSDTATDLYYANGTAAYTGVLNGMDTTNLTYSQYGNFLILCNGATWPTILIYSAGPVLSKYTWGTTQIDIAATSTYLTARTDQGHRNLPWLEENTTAITLTAGATAIGTGVSLTASAPGIFVGGMVGTYFRIRSGTSVGVLKITSVTNATTATCSIVRTLPTAGPTTVFAECAWGRFGYPRTVTFYQDRLLFGGNTYFPERVWASQISDMWELSAADPTAATAVGDDAAFAVDATLGNGATINFLSPDRKMFGGSSQREFTLVPKDEAYGIGIRNVDAVPQTSNGSAWAMPQRTFNVCTYISKSLQSLIETTFDQQQESYKSFNLNMFADHLFAPGNATTTQSIKEIAWSQDNKTMWLVTTFRDLFSVTRDPETGVLAWSRHVLGGSGTTSGSFSLDTSNPSVISVCVMENVTSSVQYGFDEVFMVVARTINSTLKIYVEKMTYVTSDYLDIDDMNAEHLDCSVSGYDAVAKTSWAALAAHLPSTTVHVMADGIYVGTKTLTAAGNLTLDTAANYVSVGFNYESTLIPVALQSNSLFGSGLGQIKRTEEVTILFDRTTSCKFGTSTNSADLDEINFREDSVAAAAPTPLFSGEKTLKLEASYETRQKLMFKVDEPLPCTILAVVAKGILYD